MLLITSPRFEEHMTPPGHPERMERAHVFDAVAARWREKGGRTADPRPIRRDALERVHDAAYLDEIERVAGRPAMLDEDTFMSPESQEIALLAAGAAVQAAEHALDRSEPAFALVRPPGHHAERDRAMGFCLYNNVAVAAAWARARGIERVAVVDIDVHHGNGTQWMFYGDPAVLYVSSHQYPFYPGTGAADETGVRDGEGRTVNIPLEAGATDADYELVYRAVVGPVLDQFAPQLTIVSAGYDAHERDPLASMRMSADGYAAIVSIVNDAARRHGALALVTEGGYELTALAQCLEASFDALEQSGARRSPFEGLRATLSHVEASALGARGVTELQDSGSIRAARGERALAAVRAAQASFWRGI